MTRGHSLAGVMAGIVFTAAAVALVGAGPAAPEAFSIDAVHSTAIFRVRHLGAGPFYGRFNDVTGTVSHDGADRLELEVLIVVDSVDTSSERLDGHLKSPDFFNAKEFPTMGFKSNSAKKRADNQYTITGDLTIHGVTKSIKANAEWIGTKDMGRGQRCGFEVVFKINRSDFGMTMGVDQGTLGDEVKVIVALEAAASKER